jgi:cell wall-associated NlpC family hydrolase
LRFDDDKLRDRHASRFGSADHTERTITLDMISNTPVSRPAAPNPEAAGRSTSHAARRGVRRAVAALAVAVGAGVGAFAVTPSPVEAAQSALPTNAMAPIVTSSAREALASYDEYLATDDPAAYRKYVWYRTQTAQYAATEIGYPQHDMAAAWAATTVEHQLAVLAAMTQVGVPYRSNSSKEGVGFDCSGLTTYAWARAGVSLVRQSGQQIRDAEPLDRSTAKAGDLVQYPGHVMMYLGVGDAVIHSVMSGRTVELDTISERQASRVRFGDPTP